MTYLQSLTHLEINRKLVKTCLLAHLTSNFLLNPFQSAYNKNYSAKTPLLSLHDHLLNAMSHQQVVFVFLISSLPSILLITQSYFTISLVGLAFFSFSLMVHLIFVVSHILHCHSTSFISLISSLTCGVPQCSFWAPLFSFFTYSS